MPPGIQVITIIGKHDWFKVFQEIEIIIEEVIQEVERIGLLGTIATAPTVEDRKAAVRSLMEYLG